jgi:hypothetical protein
MDRAVIDRHIAGLRSAAEDGDVALFARNLSELLLVVADLIDADADPAGLVKVVTTINDIVQRFRTRSVH